MRIVGQTIAVLMIVMLSMVAGCSKPGQPVGMQGSFDNAPVNTTLLQAQPNGATFMLANGIAECLGKSYPGSVINITPGSQSANVIRLVNGDAEFVFTLNTSSLAILKDHPELKGIAALRTSPSQFVLRKDINVSTVEDIIAKKVKLKLCIGLKDSVTDLSFRQILQQYNVTVADMESWGCVFVYKATEETQSLYADGAIDGYFWGFAAPNPVIVQNALDKPMKFITIDPKVIDAVCAAYGYEKITLPAGTYGFQTENYNTFTDYMILATTNKCSDATAYKMIRAIYQNLDYLTAVHASFKELNGNMMVNKLRIPMHPGALQYYKEVGLVK